MKQLDLDEALRTRLKAVDKDIDPDKITVFRAAALTTAPVRKRHPVFIGAVHTVNYLNQMKAELAKESLPLHIMHESFNLHVGKIFDSEISLGTGPDGSDELITLFWIDNTHPDLIAQVNSGTLDQVSVSTLAKRALSNKTGYNFMARDADPEKVWRGVDDKGNKMGENGAHVILDELDAWFEMSLVNQGGSVGAKVLGDRRLHLTASHQDVSPLTLQLSTGGAPDPDPTPPPAPNKDIFDMDATAFAGIIAANATELANANTAKVAAEARATELQTQLTAVTTERDALKGSDAVVKLAAAEANVTELTTKLAAAEALPAKLLAPLVTTLGNATFSLPAAEADAVTMVKDAVTSVKQLGHQLSLGMHHGAPAPQAGSGVNNAFKRRA